MEALIIAGLAAWLVFAIRSTKKKGSGCCGNCSKCCSVCRKIPEK